MMFSTPSDGSSRAARKGDLERRERMKLFTLRRTMWMGRCRRADLAAAFDLGTSLSLATSVLDESIRQWPDLLYRSGKTGVFRKQSVRPPREADAATMLQMLSRGAEPHDLGLFPHEISALIPEYDAALPTRPSAADVILESLLRRTPIEIDYVGLRIGDKRRIRRVMPIAIEFTGRSWRLVAHDLDDAPRAEGKPGYRVKSYSFGRIFDAKALSSSDLPRGFVPRVSTESTRVLRVGLSSRLTADQAQALRNEYGIRPDDTMKLPRHSLFDFLRLNTTTPASRDIVWPPITSYEELD
jgi:hypothetical protein